MVQEAVSCNVDQRGVATILFDAPDRPVNVITFEIGKKLSKILEDLGKREELLLVVFRSEKEKNFIAGADITEIESIQTAEEGVAKSRQAQRIPDLIEALKCPSLAIINGACLGGGLELALGCTYRIAVSAAHVKIGLPEVQLGFIPGMGGTYRLPQLIGLTRGLEMVLSGKQVNAEQARRFGIVDSVIPAELIDEELDRIVELIEEDRETFADRNKRALSLLARSWRKVARSPLERFLEKSSPGRRLIFKQVRNNVIRQAGGHYPAPLKAIEVIRASYGEPEEYALKLESEGFGELAASDISKNLVRLFFMRERALKGKNRGSVAKRVERMGVLGAGTMGAGIAQLAIWNEIPVRLKDVNHEAVAHGISAAYRVSEEALKRRKVTEREMRQKMRFLSGTTDYSGFKQLDLVVEAVVEDLNIKRRTYRELESVIPNGAIIATNTSSLPMDELAAEMKNPARFVAMHFFNPVHRMPLLEISSCGRTSPEVLETAVHFARRVEKVPLVVKACPGFLVNRLLMPYLNEAGILVEEGAEVEKIDRAMVEFGMPMGPLRLVDEVGIDVAFKVASVLEKAYGERAKAPLLMEQIYNNGFLGRKSGIGFYRYEKGKQAGKRVDPRAAHLIEEVRESVRGAERRKTGAERLNSNQLVERMVMAMLNEAVRVLAEKIVVSPDDIDLGMMMGTGFPPFLGGPMRFADSLGLESVAETLQRLYHECGERFKPAELLLKMAGEGRTFASLANNPA